MPDASAIDPRLEPLLALLAEILVREALADHHKERRDNAEEVDCKAA
jgi:hypothetical protein